MNRILIRVAILLFRVIQFNLAANLLIEAVGVFLRPTSEE